MTGLSGLDGLAVSAVTDPPSGENTQYRYGSLGWPGWLLLVQSPPPWALTASEPLPVHSTWWGPTPPLPGSLGFCPEGKARAALAPTTVRTVVPATTVAQRRSALLHLLLLIAKDLPWSSWDAPPWSPLVTWHAY